MTGFNTLLNLVNANNLIQQPLTALDVTFSDPIVDIGSNWNTKVTVSAVPGSRYTGSVDVCYTRPHLVELNNSVINNMLSEVPFTPEIILDFLNTSRGTDFQYSDVENIPIPLLCVGEIASINLTMKSNSLAWIGDTNISVLYGLPSNTNILHDLVNHILPSPGYLAMS